MLYFRRINKERCLIKVETVVITRDKVNGPISTIFVALFNSRFAVASYRISDPTIRGQVH